MNWFKRLFNPAPKAPRLLTASMVLENAKHEVPLADYPKQIYTHTWEKILGQASNGMLFVELRFFSRETGEYDSSETIADWDLKALTDKANKRIREQMPKYRKDVL